MSITDSESGVVRTKRKGPGGKISALAFKSTHRLTPSCRKRGWRRSFPLRLRSGRQAAIQVRSGAASLWLTIFQPEAADRSQPAHPDGGT